MLAKLSLMQEFLASAAARQLSVWPVPAFVTLGTAVSVTGVTMER